MGDGGELQLTIKTEKAWQIFNLESLLLTTASGLFSSLSTLAARARASCDPAATWQSGPWPAVRPSSSGGIKLPHLRPPVRCGAGAPPRWQQRVWPLHSTPPRWRLYKLQCYRVLRCSALRKLGTRRLRAALLLAGTNVRGSLASSSHLDTLAIISCTARPSTEGFITLTFGTVLSLYSHTT